MRRDDWLPRLLAYTESVRGVPYEPVKHNCALFVAGAVKEMREDDPVSGLGLNLESLRDVVEALNKFGGVAGICKSYLGEMRPPLQARRGDVVIKPGIDGDTIGICMGTHALFLGPDGLQPRNLNECSGSWRVE